MLTIRHNTVFNEFGQTDAISLFEDFGQQKDCLIENNLVAGGGYTIYGGQNTGGIPVTNIIIRNNRFSTRFFPQSGSYGPVTALGAASGGNVWSGNVWHETGLPL
jgi:hypothetical protein